MFSINARKLLNYNKHAASSTFPAVSPVVESLFIFTLSFLSPICPSELIAIEAQM